MGATAPLQTPVMHVVSCIAPKHQAPLYDHVSAPCFLPIENPLLLLRLPACCVVRQDVYGVGILAYELMTGQLRPPQPAQPAAPGDSGAASASGAVSPQPPVLVFPASVPVSARDFIRAAVSPDPADRPTAVQLLQHVWLAEAAQEAGQARRQAAEAAELAKQQQAAAAGAAAAAVAASGTVGVMAAAVGPEPALSARSPVQGLEAPLATPSTEPPV